LRFASSSDETSVAKGYDYITLFVDLYQKAVVHISDADIVKKHRIYNGELSDAVIIDKKTFVRSCQQWLVLF
jgi:hypothetical protein